MLLEKAVYSENVHFWCFSPRVLFSILCAVLYITVTKCEAQCAMQKDAGARAHTHTRTRAHTHTHQTHHTHAHHTHGAP